MEERKLPGMSEEEWRFREGRVLYDEGAQTGDYRLAAEGLDQAVDSLMEAGRSSLSERFQALFPGEPVPADIQELGYRVKEREIDLAIEEEGETF